MTAAVTAAVVFGIYRRVRRSIGRQPFQPRRLIFRVVLLIFVCVLLALLHPTQIAFIAAALGAALGAACGIYALRHTRFEMTEAGLVDIE